MTVHRFLFGAMGLTFALAATGMAEQVVVPLSLPEIFRSDLEGDSGAIEMPVSAALPSNVPESAIDSTEIIKLLQEAIEQLSAAGLKAETDDATQLLKTFEHTHPVRLSLDLPDADLVKLRSDLSWARDRQSLFYVDIELDRRVLLAGEMTVCLGNCPKAVGEYVCDDSGYDNIGSPHARCFLPEKLRSALEDDLEVTEEPTSAEEPSNVRKPAVHPASIVKSLQESVERLSAAGLKAEAEEAAQLLKNFERKHQVRLLMEIQDADLTRHRSKLDRLLRRLGRFDIDPARDGRAARVPELRAEEVKFAVVSDERNFDYGRCLIDTRPRPLGSFSYTTSPKLLEQWRKEHRVGDQPLDAWFADEAFIGSVRP
ncbi:MAG TPA: hypothetical protein VGM98_11750, partial [Schlesneria sp.]